MRLLVLPQMAAQGGRGSETEDEVPERTAIRKQLPPALYQPISAIAQTPNLTTRSADDHHVGPSRELTAPWYPKAI